MESQVRLNIKVHAISYMDFPSQSTPRIDTLQVTLALQYFKPTSQHTNQCCSLASRPGSWDCFHGLNNYTSRHIMYKTWNFKQSYLELS